MNEEVFTRATAEHWIKYVPPLIGYILMTGVSIMMFYFAGVGAFHLHWVPDVLFILATLLLFFSHHTLFHMLLSQYLDQIIITNKRLIHVNVRLFLRDEMAEIPLKQIKSVSADKKGLLQNLLRYGTVHLDPKAKFEFVPHPHAVARDIAHLLEMK